MANTDELIKEYYTWADRTGLEILEWAADAKFFDTAGNAIFPRPTKVLTVRAIRISGIWMTICQLLQDWPLTDFASALAIASAYLAFVILGRVSHDCGSSASLDLTTFYAQIFMIVCPPMTDLTYPIRFVYNIGQVMLCSYMTIEAGVLAYRNGYKIEPCNPFDTKNPPVASLLWLFYISKVFDFFDTLFIILGKKWDQLSFLHVYHHLTIFSVYWINVNIGYDGDIYLTVVLNGFIHTVMYTYYFVSMHTREIWWKKYLTMMQLAQFITMNSQAIYLLQTDCKTFPKRVTQIYLFYIITLFLLFLKFFFDSYSSKPKKGSTTSKKNQ